MGGVKSKVNVDVVQEQVKNDPVVMYTKTSCTFCTKAKDLLSNVRVTYKEVNLDDLKANLPKEYLGIVNGLVYTTRQTSVPQIFICGRFVGGFTELEALRNSGHLFEAIAQCTGENASHE
ncbi:CBN-GLRX-21 protein [Caenorhabditis brenneri]|uniref:CBN-GLRX-21 protein n=1 Tax=Caenorhabditis brenneri TaxID=135651 RepID=G0P1J6_CAEBE|nr:CBN-GLRX-21 protein [Caenorhabditis brenneri]